MCCRSASTEGIGTELLEAELAACRQHGANHVTVLVERDNALGHRFYLKRGFAEMREWSQEIEGHVLELVECYRRLSRGGYAPRRSNISVERSGSARRSR